MGNQVQVYFNLISKITHWISKKDSNKDGSDKDKLTKHWSMIIIWGVSVMMMGISLSIIFPIVNKIEPNYFEQIKLFLVLFLAIVIGNYLFAIHVEKPEKNNLPMLCFIPIFTVLFVLLMGRSTVIPKFVMSKYKFGYFETHQLLVDKNGCKILNKMKLNPDKDQEICHLENIKILSRLGRNFYLEKEIENKKRLNFTIPSKYVLSWSIINPYKKIKQVKNRTRLKPQRIIKEPVICQVRIHCMIRYF